ncbi:MAG: alpha-L-rhamnosidase C-terminal domain-containing protein, partial [Sphingobacterium sp.]
FVKKRTKGNVLVERSFEDVTPKGGFGDWLSVGDKTSPDMLATMYYFYCNKLMVDMCAAIGETNLAKSYQQEMELVRQGFKKHYMERDGKLKTDSEIYGNGEGYVEGSNGFYGHTQTAYANALYFGILDQHDTQLAGEFLRDLVAESGDKLSTGFLGFKPLLPALSASGSTDKAYQLMLSTEYPSLGYEVANGATSIWERWDSYTKDQGFIHNAAMNSFSHYAFGSVNEWMFENMIGIKSLENGFQQISIKPEIGDYGVNNVQGSYQSIAGQIKSSWSKSANQVTQQIEIPVNVTANCYLKASSPAAILVNGKAIEKLDYIQSVRQEDGFVVLELGSGKYEIKVAH